MPDICQPQTSNFACASANGLSPSQFLRCCTPSVCLCILQEHFSALPESSLPLQEPSQLFPPREQLHSLARQSLEGQPLDRQSLERQSWGRQLAQAEAALRAEQHQCDALRAQAKQSQGCALQAQLQLRRSHSRAERLAALWSEADEERKGCDNYFNAVRPCTTVLLDHTALLVPYIPSHGSILCTILTCTSCAEQRTLYSHSATDPVHAIPSSHV